MTNPATLSTVDRGAIRLFCDGCRRLRYFRKTWSGHWCCLACDWAHPEAHQ